MKNKINIYTLFITVFIFLLANSSVIASERTNFTFDQVLQQVVETYPSLKLAQLQVERARQQMIQVESTLGWNLNAGAGVNHDVSFIGAPSDVADITAGLNRKLKSGDSFGVSGQYKYSDDSLTFGPTIPNPSHRTFLDLNYRMTLGRGNENPEYTQGLLSSEAGVMFETASELSVRDQLANQTQELFYNAAKLRSRLGTAQSAVIRAKRLKKYIKERQALGLSEEKDMLQADAQYRSRLSNVKNLEVGWQQIRTTLNRLMGLEWDHEFEPVVGRYKQIKLNKQQLKLFITEVENNSPALLRTRARIKISEADIVLRKDVRKDKFDVVVSVGTRTASGDAVAGSVNEQDLAGGVRLEYQRSLDQRGFDASLYQAQLDKQIAEDDNAKIREDLKYQVSGLVAEIDASEYSVESFKARLKSENLKFDDALKRYELGRVETDRLIQFENELQTARFELEDQKIDYERRYKSLNILRGKIWDDVTLPAYGEQ
jgi:outer membrane protein TolC